MDQMVEVEMSEEMISDIIELVKTKYPEMPTVNVLATFYALTLAVSEESGIPLEAFHGA